MVQLELLSPPTLRIRELRDPVALQVRMEW